MKLLSKNLLYLRKMNGWQQSEMFDRIGIRATTWSMYENDKSQPTLETLMMISNFFEVSETDLLRKDLSADVHLIAKTDDKKNQQNVHPNVHASVLPSTKIEVSKEYKNLLETEFNMALNEDETPITWQQRMERFLATVAENEAKTAKKIAELESKINYLVRKTPKK